MDKPDYQTCIYHQIKSPKGTDVMYSEAVKMFRKGWVDTPAKFGKGIRGKWYNVIIYSRTTLKQFWIDNWKWIITTSIAIPALYLSLTK